MIVKISDERNSHQGRVKRRAFEESFCDSINFHTPCYDERMIR